MAHPASADDDAAPSSALSPQPATRTIAAIAGASVVIRRELGRRLGDTAASVLHESWMMRGWMTLHPTPLIAWNPTVTEPLPSGAARRA